MSVIKFAFYVLVFFEEPMTSMRWFLEELSLEYNPSQADES